MSAAGSPVADGSPGGSLPAAGIDGAELARRMVQAAEAASAAATAAIEAVAAMGMSTSSGSWSTGAGGDWFKVLPKPAVFDPKDREAELSGFRDWWWQVEQYVGAFDPKFSDDLDYIRKHLDEELPLVEQTVDRTRRSGFL